MQRRPLGRRSHFGGHEPAGLHAGGLERSEGRAGIPQEDSRVVRRARSHHVTGAWNYLLKVRIRTTRELEAFLSDTVKAVPGVQRTETIIALSSAKETWTLDMS